MKIYQGNRKQLRLWLLVLVLAASRKAEHGVDILLQVEMRVGCDFPFQSWPWPEIEE